MVLTMNAFLRVLFAIRTPAAYMRNMAKNEPIFVDFSPKFAEIYDNLFADFCLAFHCEQIRMAFSSFLSCLAWSKL